MRLATPAEYLEHQLQRLAARHFQNGSVPEIVTWTLNEATAKKCRAAVQKLLNGSDTAARKEP